MSKIIILNENARKIATDLINTLNLEKTWVVTIERKKNQRTLSQNALYWKWVDIIGEELGYFKTDMHELLKGEHLPPKIIMFQGEEHLIRSIKNLTTDEMSKYMGAVSFWAGSEIGIMLPYPEDQQRNQ